MADNTKKNATLKPPPNNSIKPEIRCYYFLHPRAFTICV